MDSRLRGNDEKKLFIRAIRSCNSCSKVSFVSLAALRHVHRRIHVLSWLSLMALPQFAEALFFELLCVG
jgi:hypothetical protein